MANGICAKCGLKFSVIKIKYNYKEIYKETYDTEEFKNCPQIKLQFGDGCQFLKDSVKQTINRSFR